MRRLHATLARVPGIRRLRRIVPNRLWSSVARILRPASSDPWYLPLRAAATARLVEASRRDTAAWEAVETLDDWNDFVRPRVEALRASLGVVLDGSGAPETHCTGTLAGDGYVIEKLIFSSRPGLWITANLYRPSTSAEPAPAILLCHSHHFPKSQAELQDMGVGWARAGSPVLVPDLLGHGERRDHPFDSAADHPRPYRVSRQDYWFRYVLGLQLDLIGESLTGWMVRDLIRSVDLLHARREVDPRRIVLVGSVAGGGDVAAVTAALDRRIACVVPFNFGDTGEPRLTGSGSWESTRSLRDSARDGFLPWVILAATAPRNLICAREFGWSAEEDPAWARLERVWELHGARARLASIHGRGSISGPPPYSTHCTNVGPYHRAQIDSILREWFGISPPTAARAERRSDGDLRCWTPESRRALDPRAVHRLARESLPRADAPGTLRDRLAGILGATDPPKRPIAPASAPRRGKGGCEIVEIETDPTQRILLRIFLPTPKPGLPPPHLVLAVAQDGGRALLARRGEVVRGLLGERLAVCLADVRGTGPSNHDDETRGRHSPATEVASSEEMLGRTLLGARLRDARCALGYLRIHSGIDASRVAVWGDSLARPNDSTEDLRVPFDSGPSPTLAEPLGATLALLLALYEPEVRAVCACGGLISFASLLDDPFCHVPRDIIVPGLLKVADVPDLLEALSEVAVRIEAPIDGMNRPIAAEPLERFRQSVANRHDLTVVATRRPARETVAWIAGQLDPSSAHGCSRLLGRPSRKS